jgi:hypothetical protein
MNVKKEKEMNVNKKKSVCEKDSALVKQNKHINNNNMQEIYLNVYEYELFFRWIEEMFIWNNVLPMMKYVLWAQPKLMFQKVRVSQFYEPVDR